jgi:hypothetical protein
MNTQAIVDVLKRHLTPQQLGSILEEIKNTNPCLGCSEPAIPVDARGDETEDETLIVAYQENHSRHCLVPLIEKALREGERE